MKCIELIMQYIITMQDKTTIVSGKLTLVCQSVL